VIAVVSVVALSLLCYRLVIEPVREHEAAVLIATIALGLIFQELMLVSYGGHFLGVPSTIDGVVRVAGVSIPYQRLLILVVAGVMLAATWIFSLPHAHRPRDPRHRERPRGGEPDGHERAPRGDADGGIFGRPRRDCRRGRHAGDLGASAHVARPARHHAGDRRARRSRQPQGQRDRCAGHRLRRGDHGVHTTRGRASQGRSGAGIMVAVLLARPEGLFGVAFEEER